MKTYDFEMRVGAALRGRRRSLVELIAARNNVRCAVTEAKSFLESIYLFKCEGADGDVDQFDEDLRHIFGHSD